MRTRRGVAIPTLLVAIGASWLVPLGVPTAGATSHASITVTLSASRVEHGDKVSARLCWQDAPASWTAQLTAADAPAAVPALIYSARVAERTGCVSVQVPTGARGVHPVTGQLLTTTAVQFVTAVTFLYVYAPIAGSVFVKNLLTPACHGSGVVVIRGTNRAWTCSMRAVTSHLTVPSTTCRSVTFALASTDDPSGDASSPGKSIFELAQNVIAPSFKRFHDDVVAAKSLPLSGSAFWVAFKSTHPASRLYFLNKGAEADCYSSSGTA